MSVVRTIISALGGVSVTAAELAAPVQTVSSWHTKESIPAWRRGAVMEFARRKQTVLPPDAWVYLAGGEAAVAAAMTGEHHVSSGVGGRK